MVNFVETFHSTRMSSTNQGKVIVITGASSGIGQAIARLLTQQGAIVVLGARREDRLIELVHQIKEEGKQATYALTDVSQQADLTRLVELARQQYGKVDAIINNAGVSELSRMDELQIGDWEKMIDINLKGVLYGIAAGLAVFKQQGFGHIITIISTSGIKITPNQGVYAGTKNAVRTIHEALRQESKGKYRVTGISPGMVKTDFVAQLKNEALKKAITDQMDTFGLPPEAVARAVAFALEQPDDVEIGDIVIRPTAQD